MRYVLLIALVVLPLMAQKKHDHSHDHEHKHSKTQKAHDHGSVQLDIAVDGKTADFELHTAAMGVVGFEHVATSAVDKKKQADALAALKANFPRIVSFDPAAGCKFSAKSVEVNQEEPDHAEIDGHFVAQCSKDLAGQKVTFDFSKFYPAFSSVKVQVVANNGSTGADLKGGRGSVSLPK